MSASASQHPSASVAPAGSTVPSASADGSSEMAHGKGNLGIFRLATTVITLIMGGGVFTLSGDQAAGGACCVLS